MGPKRSPINRITGTCVAHMKLMMIINPQSIVFCDFNMLMNNDMMNE